MAEEKPITPTSVESQLRSKFGGALTARYTYGSRLATQGVPMAVIAAQLGHSDTRITSTGPSAASAASEPKPPSRPEATEAILVTLFDFSKAAKDFAEKHDIKLFSVARDYLKTDYRP